MERKIGEIFEYNGEWYQCLAAIDVIYDGVTYVDTVKIELEE